MECRDIEKIVDELKIIYPNVCFEIEYVEEDDDYFINMSNAEIEDTQEFKEFASGKIQEVLKRGEDVNFYFYYDCELEEKVRGG